MGRSVSRARLTLAREREEGATGNGPAPEASLTQILQGQIAAEDDEIIKMAAFKVRHTAMRLQALVPLVQAPELREALLLVHEALVELEGLARAAACQEEGGAHDGCSGKAGRLGTSIYAVVGRARS